MQNKLLVSGMHCQSCVSLVKMELIEAGLENNIVEINLLDNMQGEVILKEVDTNQIQNAIQAINNLADYQVVKHD